MEEQEFISANPMYALDAWWIGVNSSFLARYWHTSSEALQQVIRDPTAFTEFQSKEDTARAGYVNAVVSSHLEHHNYSGVLLAYAVFDECMAVLTRKLGQACDARLLPGDLRAQGINRYREFIHKVCRIDPQRLHVNWDFLEDFTTVRNAIIHANGNKSLLRNRRELEAVVERRTPALSFKHTSKLVISDEFVVSCMAAGRNTALMVNDLMRPEP